MSRCKACDQILTEYELKKRDPVNVNLFLDLCGPAHSILMMHCSTGLEIL